MARVVRFTPVAPIGRLIVNEAVPGLITAWPLLLLNDSRCTSFVETAANESLANVTPGLLLVISGASSPARPLVKTMRYGPPAEPMTFTFPARPGIVAKTPSNWAAVGEPAAPLDVNAGVMPPEPLALNCTWLILLGTEIV